MMTPPHLQHLLDRARELNIIASYEMDEGHVALRMQLRQHDFLELPSHAPGTDVRSHAMPVNSARRID